MILDTSAVISILLKEKETLIFSSLVANSEYVGIAAPTLAETGIVLGKRLDFKLSILHRFIQVASISIMPFSDLHWQTAVKAYEIYGKGIHPAKLNFGDCFSYSAAKLAKQPLLCKGNDFTQTDIQLVAY